MKQTIYTIIIILIVPITEIISVECKGQQVLNLSALAEEALSTDATEAATYFLYADYLKSPDTFPKLEMTAYLLSNSKEFSKADTLLHRIQATKKIDELSDSLRFYYYASRAMVDYENKRYSDVILSLSKINLTDKLAEIKGSCFAELGLFEQALQVFFSSMSNQNPSRTNCLIGRCYRQMGRFQDAIEYFSRALATTPQWGYPYYGIGWSYELSGDDGNALKYYNDGLAVDQTYAYLYLMRGEMLLKHGQKDLAEDDFNSVLRLDH